MRLREPIGFARLFSARTARKTPEIQKVFPEFSILSGRKIPPAKLPGIARRDIFVSGEAKSAGIMEIYFEHFQ
ncbi:MAG: hypothetical protein J5827_03605, partial [Oscillospiraceae bacterium]|nr:hypothetical protein [Oscillospiraceae bacterium]